MDVPVIESDELGGWVEELTSQSSRVLLGMAGPPGSGKSTVAAGLAARFEAPIVGMDGFHLALDVVEANGWLEVKGAPHTFDAWGFVALLDRLAGQEDGETVYAPRYDRAARNPIGSAVPISTSHDLVIIEGNYLLLDEPPWDRIPGLLTRCIYLDLDATTRVERLVERHIRFGKEPDHARRFVATSDETNARLVAATRERADVIVNVG